VSRRLRAVPAALAVVLATALAAPLAVLAPLGTAATASPVGDARARAIALRQEVDRLRVQAAGATEDYDQAQDDLGRAVGDALAAQALADDAATAAGAQSSAAGRRVRALYTSGGPLGLYAAVLDGSDAADALARLRTVSAVVAADALAAGRTQAALAESTALQERATDLADRRTALSAALAGQADRVRALLARTDALLAGADADVRRLAEQQRAAQEAEAARAAAAALATARAGELSGGDLSRGDLSRGDLPGGDRLSTAGTPSARGLLALAEARRHLGAPYLWGAGGPDAFDCSGLTVTAYRAAGVTLPRTSRQQWFAGRHVSLAALAPGDLLFWAADPADPATIHHVALYAGDGLMVAAPHAGAVVRVQPVYLEGYAGAVRP
jgi:cell wall-associated NlpC family hydrolase